MAQSREIEHYKQPFPEEDQGKPSSQKSYLYNTLPQGGHFRYLVLQPGANDEPLQCSLHTAFLLSDTSSVHFEAISYVWGDYTKNKIIYCDGRILHITTNLSTVLQRVRRADVPRNLWADSICINQDDLEEKGHQVANMGKIYRAAESVLIYIGSDDGGDGPHVCSILKEVNAMIKDAWKHVDMSWNSFPYSAGIELLGDKRWHSLYILLHQPWFTRGWVVQEAVLAKQGHILWGKSELIWDELMRAYIWLMRRTPKNLQFGNFSADYLSTIHVAAYSKSHKRFYRAFCNALQSLDEISILQSLHCARPLHVSDPRDRIFAFLGLLSKPNEQLRFTPNYQDSYLEVYHQFASQYISTTKDARILGFVTHNTETWNMNTPSWVPRWDISLSPIHDPRISNQEVLKSRAKSKPTLELLPNDVLQAQGVIADSVEYVSDVLTIESTLDVIARVWKSAGVERVAVRGSPYEASRLIDVFLDTLCLSSFIGESKKRNQARDEFVANTGLLIDNGIGSERLADSFEELEGPTKFFADHIRTCIHGKRFVVTKRGYMGMAPMLTEEGDICSIIFGCDMPSILKHSTGKDCYRFVGGAYVLGKAQYMIRDGTIHHYVLGDEESRDWLDWDVEEQVICLC